MFLKLLTQLGAKPARRILERRAARILGRIGPWLPRQGLILELGPGGCTLTMMLRARGYRVIPLDVRDLSLVPEVKPVLYDGYHPPFREDTFACGLALFVFHHIEYCERCLRRILPLAREWIIAEDLYQAPWQSRFTAVTDRVLNLLTSEKAGLGRSDAQWRALFQRLGWQVAAYQRHGSDFSITPWVWQTTYLLKKSHRTPSFA